MTPSVTGIEEWWSTGERISLPLSGADRSIFVRRMGAGPMMTLLHGFPSSSHDWAKVVPALTDSHALLVVDFLGFGASEKPTDHDYSLHEQADLVEALWARDGVTSTVLVAHDYAVSVTQELLARRAEGKLATDLVAVHLLNGGLYPDLHRAQPTQMALLDPEQGPQLSALLTEELIVPALKPTFADGFDAAADSADMWRAMSRDGGQRIMHLLIRYISDRESHRERWVACAGDDRRAGGLRLGDARSDLGRAHGRADPRAHARRALPGTRRRRALAVARSAATGGGRRARRVEVKPGRRSRPHAG